MPRGIKRLCAVLIGLTFLVSGLLKLQDPLGTSLIVKEYFSFFGTSFLNPTAKFIAVLLSLAESLCGAALIVGVWKKLFALFASALMLFFTLVTLVLAIANPAMDCGCFGEAVHLTNFQTFAKNIVLDILCVAAFLPLSSLEGECRPRKFVAFFMVAAVLLWVMLHSLTRLPFVDFTDFAPGNELLGGNPADDNTELRDTVFVYERNSQRGEFSPDRLPDESWKYVEKKLNKMNLVARSDRYARLDIRNQNGELCNAVLTEGDVVTVSLYSPQKLGVEDWSRISEFFLTLQMLGMQPLLLLPDASVAPIDLSDYAYSVDRKALMSLNRSNGGVCWIHDAGIIAKWAKTNIPSPQRWETMSEANPWEYSMAHTSRGRIYFQAIFLYSLGLLLLI